MEAHDIQYIFLGNNLAVDFVNTEIVSRGELIDLIQNGTDLKNWAQDAGLSLNGRISEDDLKTVKALRVALKDTFHSKIDKRPPNRSAVVQINQHLIHYASNKVLQVNNNEFLLVPNKDASSIRAILARLAYEAVTLLVSPQAARLKPCGNKDCVLLFVDTSRGQKRRWCSMETCGNRAKVAKHYRSHLPK